MLSSVGIQLKIIDINPSTYPTNKVPESPRYNFAGGKLYIKNPNNDAKRINEISVTL